MTVPDPTPLLEPLLRLHVRIRDGVVEACARQSGEELSAVASDAPGDTIYAIDRVSEALVVSGLESLASDSPIRLVMEGLPGGWRILPDGTPAEECVWRVIVDPIDGTRGLMYQKRSAWVLTGVAPERGRSTSLADVTLAVQTEIPLLKQHLSDQLWAVKGAGATARRHDRTTDGWEPLRLRPSEATDLAHGYASVSQFFPGARDVLAAIDEEVVFEVMGPPKEGKAACFEDQYASTGGQLYELICGHDRFIADLRPLLAPVYARRGLAPGLACHPYDVCTALIAQELGVLLTDGAGGTLDVPLDVDTAVSWAGYANAALRTLVEPALLRALERRDLLPERPPTQAS